MLNVIILHRRIFGNDDERKNLKGICKFTGFPFETKSDEHEKQNDLHRKGDFRVKELITIWNVLCVDNDLTSELFLT